MFIPCHNDCIQASRLCSDTQWPADTQCVVVSDRCAFHAKPPPGVLLWKGTRAGKARALNEAIDKARTLWPSTPYFGFSDADTHWALPESWERIREAFQVPNPPLAVMPHVVLKEGNGWLVRMQRAELENQYIDHVEHRGVTDILAGQTCVISSSVAHFPEWSEVEDQALTYDLREQFGDSSCAVVPLIAITDPMSTLRGWWAQRRKWNTGTLRLIPNLTKRYGLIHSFGLSSRFWSRSISSLIDISSRLLLMILLFAIPSFWPLWLALAFVLVLLSTPWRGFEHKYHGLLWEPYQFLLWLNVAVSLGNSLLSKREDLWEKQELAEAGIANSVGLIPAIVGALSLFLLALVLMPFSLILVLVRQLYRIYRGR